jgi:hypothetical protein
MKYIITENQLNRAALKYLNTEYGDLEPYKTDEFPDYIFYMKDGEVILQYNKKNGVVFISYDHIWTFLGSFFGLKDEEIQVITKEWVEEHYNLRVITIQNNWMHRNLRWRDITNLIKNENNNN